MAKVGRKPIKEEREIREALQKFLPDIILFYEQTFKSGGVTFKEKISSKILDKIIPNASPQMEEFEDRLTQLEQLALKG